LTFQGLRPFRADEIIISKAEAVAIIRFFWPDSSAREAGMSDDAVAFAQGLLVEAIDASYAMGHVHAVFDVFYMRPPGTVVNVKKMIRTFGKKASRHWFKYATEDKLQKAEIYNTVRVRLANNFKSQMILLFAEQREEELN
jgi:hypothetical protein